MVTGYEADFYRQFAAMTKDVHRIAFATEGIVVMLKKNNENNVSVDIEGVETTLVGAIQELTDAVRETGNYEQDERIAQALERLAKMTYGNSQ